MEDKKQIGKNDKSISFAFNQRKISTGIDGLDKLLYGGLQMQQSTENNKIQPLSIVIYGENGTSKALFAMQLLHGTTKSLRKIYPQEYLAKPVFISEKRKENMEDMFLDYIISKSIKQIIEDKIIDKNYKQWEDNDFAYNFFDKNDCDAFFKNNSYSIDKYIYEGIITYNCQEKTLEYAILRWIMKDNRFLCFVLHKANGMAESNDILKTFNSYYKIQ